MKRVFKNVIDKYSDNKRVPEYVYNYNNTIFKKT